MMRRTALASALAALVVGALTACGAPDAAPSPTPSSPAPSATGATPTPTASASSTPTPTPTPTGAAPVSPPAPIEPPPIIGLPDPGAAATGALPVAGVDAVAGERYDLLVVCAEPYAAWSSDAEATIGRPAAAAAFSCAESPGAVIAAMAVPGEQAQLHAVLEPDTVPQPALRVAAGDVFGAEAMAWLEEQATPSWAYGITVSCGASTGDVTVAGSLSQWCEPGGWLYFDPVPAWRPLPEVNVPDGFDGQVEFMPL